VGIVSGFQVRSVTGGGDTEIAYRVFDSPGADDAAESLTTLVFVHGWAQSSRAWGDELLAGFAGRRRVIAVDLRGHGASEVAPADAYTAENFAADLRAVLAAEGVDGGAVLIGWSYGGLASCDYLSVYGTDIVDGIVLVGAITSMGRGQPGGEVGPAMKSALPEALSEDPRTAIRALGSFGTAMVPADRPELGPMSQQLFGTSLATPPQVRRALFARSAAYDDLLAALDIPALIVFGTADPVVDPSVAQHAHALLPRSELSPWDGVAHAPFLEDPERFLRDVETFAAQVESADASLSGEAR
jgi:non-heme chloroperoxidase